MPGDDKTYKVGKDVYTIPDTEVKNFLSDYPNAQEINSFTVGKDTFDIPIKEVSGFVHDNPNAVSLKKKEVSQTSSQSSQTSSQNYTEPSSSPSPTNKDPFAKYGLDTHKTPQQQMAEYGTNVQQAKQEVTKERVKNAAVNTAKLYFKNNRITPTKSSLNAKVKELKQAHDNGNLITYNEGGEDRLARPMPFYGDFWEGIKNDVSGLIRSGKLMTMSDDEKIAEFNKKKEPDSEYLPEKADDRGFWYGVGNAAPTTVLAAGSAALAETPAGAIGLSLLATEPKVVGQTYETSLEQYYKRAKNENPNIGDNEALDMAKKAATASAAEAGVTNVAMMVAGGESLPKGEGQGLIKATTQFLKNQPKTIAATNAVAGVGSELKDEIAKKVGFKVTNQEISDNLGHVLKGNTLMQLAFNVGSGVFHVPKYLKSQGLEVLSNAKPEEVQAVSDAAVKNGDATQFQADKLQTDLAEYQKAKQSVPEGLSEEKTGVLAGLIQKKQQLETKVKSLDPNFKDQVEAGINEILAIDKKINLAKRAKEPLKVEADNLTGEKNIQEEPKTENNAIQEQGASGVLQHTQEGTGIEGGERGRVESSQQGDEATVPSESLQENANPQDQNNVQEINTQDGQTEQAASGDRGALQTTEGEVSQEGSDESGSTGSSDRPEEVRQSEVPKPDEETINAIQDGVNQSHSEELKKKVSDFFDKLKLDESSLYSIPLSPKLINDFIEIVKRSVLGGINLFQAVKTGLQHLKDQDVSDEDLNKVEKEFYSRVNLGNEEKQTVTKDRLNEVLQQNKKNKSFATSVRDSKIIDNATNVVKGVIRAFHPATFEGKDLARDTMQLIRKHKGYENFENEKADTAHGSLLDFWNKQKKLDKLSFILSIENKSKYGEATPEYQHLADSYKQRMDKVFETLSDIKDVPYTEDYFPHFWEKPDEVMEHFAAAYSKSPLEGGKSFLKKRFFKDILAGIEAGYELATDNPEEMVRLAEMNALKFQTAHDIFGEMKERGLVKFSKNGDQPEGWKLVDDPLFKRIALFKNKQDEASMINGGYYMPEAVANVVNNYLSRGLNGSGVVGKTIYQGIREWNNIKNLFQLGLGAFHFTTTTIDSTVTGVGNALNKLIAGKISGLKDLAEAITVLPNIARTLSKGNDAINKFKTGQISPEVQSLIEANGRTGLQKIYTLDSWYNLKKSFFKLRADNDFKQLPSIIKNSILFIPESVAKPLMSWYVPRLKVGGFLRTLENELNLKKGLTSKEILRERQRIWDDMDDRLGQMVYDNIFWNKSMKDLAFMTIRSFGWTGGTIRAFGKGIGEIPSSVAMATKGEGISPRTAWLLSLPVTVGAYGAMYQYMMTGKPPEELKDYFFPKDGSKNADGTDRRISLPSYMKDFFSYSKHPIKTLAHKTAPAPNEIIELLNNEDFYDTQIWNPDDPAYKKGLEIMQYELKSFQPFSFRTNDDKSTPKQQVEQKFGLMPAAKEFQRTPLQNTIVAATVKKYGDDVKTQADAERISARRQIREALSEGKKFDDIPKELTDKAQLTDVGKRAYIRDAVLDPYKRMFRELTSEEQLRVWSTMTPEDKKQYSDFLNNKDSFENLKKTKPEVFTEDIDKNYEEVIKEAHNKHGKAHTPPKPRKH